ncbi:MAG: glycosyltransferase [Elusimicrobia bacterium]|nr:glycosyltransferase [Elusimicrobiota bacterium]
MRTVGKAGPRIVFVYGDRPSGHSAAAAALRDQLKRLAPRVQTSEIALATEVAPVVGPVISAAYLSLIQKTPRLWNYLYDNRTVAAALKEIREPLGALHRLRLRRHFKQLEPDLVVCTHALACAVLETDRADGTLRAPLAAVLTDYGVHEYWVSTNVDLYLAPSASVRHQLLARGVAGDRIEITGIPVHPRFRERLGREAAREAFRLDPAGPVVLFEGGSKGLGPIDEMIDPLLKAVPRAQALVVCGRNQELYLALRARYGRRRQVRLLGFTSRMPECFAAADILVGKPGGVTASEAASCGLPLVIVDPLPGQELKNCSFLTRAGAAVQLDEPGRLGALLAALLRTPRRLSAMRAAARRAAPADSALQASKLLLELLPTAAQML